MIWVRKLDHQIGKLVGLIRISQGVPVSACLIHRQAWDTSEPRIRTSTPLVSHLTNLDPFPLLIGAKWIGVPQLINTFIGRPLRNPAIWHDMIFKNNTTDPNFRIMIKGESPASSKYVSYQPNYKLHWFYQINFIYGHCLESVSHTALKITWECGNSQFSHNC